LIVAREQGRGAAQGNLVQSSATSPAIPAFPATYNL
jgi:hypothetical protein